MLADRETQQQCLQGPPPVCGEHTLLIPHPSADACRLKNGSPSHRLGIFQTALILLCFNSVRLLESPLRRQSLFPVVFEDP